MQNHHQSKPFDRFSLELRATKGRAERLVPLNAQIKRELQEYIASRGLGPESLLFSNREGHPICHDNFKNRVFPKDLIASGIRKIRFHDLRHTAATPMISKGLNPALVQAVLGHESISTTMNYVHVVGADLQNAAKVFGIGAP